MTMSCMKGSSWSAHTASIRPPGYSSPRAWSRVAASTGWSRAVTPRASPDSRGARGPAVVGKSCEERRYRHQHREEEKEKERTRERKLEKWAIHKARVKRRVDAQTDCYRLFRTSLSSQGLRSGSWKIKSHQHWAKHETTMPLISASYGASTGYVTSKMACVTYNAHGAHLAYDSNKSYNS